jgi:hypothetical protein
MQTELRERLLPFGLRALPLPFSIEKYRDKKTILCHIWEEHRLRVVENMAPREIYGSKWRK